MNTERAGNAEANIHHSLFFKLIGCEDKYFHKFARKASVHWVLVTITSMADTSCRRCPCLLTVSKRQQFFIRNALASEKLVSRFVKLPLAFVKHLYTFGMIGGVEDSVYLRLAELSFGHRNRWIQVVVHRRVAELRHVCR